MTPDEEFDLIFQQINNIPDYLPLDVHPNVIRAANIRAQKLWKRYKNLVASAEYIEYNPTYDSGDLFSYVSS